MIPQMEGIVMTLPELFIGQVCYFYIGRFKGNNNILKPFLLKEFQIPLRRFYKGLASGLGTGVVASGKRTFVGSDADDCPPCRLRRQ